MSQGLRRPHEAVDYGALVAAYPPPPEYLETAYLADPETLERNVTRMNRALEDIIRKMR